MCKVDTPPFSDLTWENILHDFDNETKEKQADGFTNLELRSTTAESGSLSKAVEHFMNMGMKRLPARFSKLHI